MSQIELLPNFVKPKRQLRGDPLILIAKQQLWANQLETGSDEFLYISRLEGGNHDFFLGMVTAALNSDTMHALTTNPNPSRRCLAAIQTAFGEVVEAEVIGVINKSELTEDQREVASHYLSPYKETPSDVHPEIFTYASTFNHVISQWPMIHSLQHIRELSDTMRALLMGYLFTAGLGVLENETNFKHINLAAKRLRLLAGSQQIGLGLVSNIHAVLRHVRMLPGENVRNLAPEQHSLVYFHNFNGLNSHFGELMVPAEWMWTAFEKPIPALCSLIYASSLVRDDYYGKLRGGETYFSRELGSSAEVSNLPIAIKRAEGLVTELHREVDKYDGRVYFINSKADGFMREIQRRYPYGAMTNLYYPDPPDKQKDRIYQL